MAALDDRYDVLDQCKRMGLDYNRLDHQERARAEMYKRFKGRGKGKGGPLSPGLAKLWKQRYGGEP